MQFYCTSLTDYKRLPTKEVKVGNLFIGNNHPIRIQTMTTTDTMNTQATVEQTIKCVEAGAELIRITAPSKNEAENLYHIKNELLKRNIQVPLVADIHFTPNAAEIAARYVEKVRINPGNFVDKKKFEILDFTDRAYASEILRIEEKFIPFLNICKQHQTAIRIGVNHGSLSDRIMSRYGDTSLGMVESAMEFLRIARSIHFHQMVLSMKSSNPQVMVQAYRLLIKTMNDEFQECYPLHIGVTEAGDGDDGRIKSAIGIGVLLEDGIGDTIRVSLTEDPEFEIPVCKNLIKRYTTNSFKSNVPLVKTIQYSPFNYCRNKTFKVKNIGDKQVPVVIADFSKIVSISIQDFLSAGYQYQSNTDKWLINEQAADYIFTNNNIINFNLPGSIGIIINANTWLAHQTLAQHFPIFSWQEFLIDSPKHQDINFVMIDCFSEIDNEISNAQLQQIALNKTVVLCLSTNNKNALQSIRRFFILLNELEILNPVILITDSTKNTADESLLHFAIETGGLFLDGFGDGICLGVTQITNEKIEFNLQNQINKITNESFLNNTAFNILQACRMRISKTEYISCPSCGRTLFDLQETTAKIRSVTQHLKGVKIAIMGCIVNGPGEMADADFGYVGSGPGKITLYKGKEIIKKNINSQVSVTELIQLIKESGAWIEP